MFTLMGAGLLSAALLLLSWMVAVTRRPGAAGWLQSDLVAVTMSLFVSGLMAFGMGFLFRGLIDPVGLYAEVGPAGVGGLAVLLLLTAWAVRRLWRRGGSGAGRADVLPMPQRPQPSAPAPRRRAA